MEQKKERLRNQLFEKYFDNKTGITLYELMEKIKIVIETWLCFHELLEKNSEDINRYTRIELVEQVNYNTKKYLFIKFLPWNYLIIDLDKLKVLSVEEISAVFEESFFVNNYNEKYINEGENSISLYWFYTYSGEISKLIDFYIKNMQLLNLPKEIFYKIEMDEAWTYLAIKITNGKVQLGFQTEDQLLYERLFINADLTPALLQDAQSKIGKKRIFEMFNRIKDIIIPFEAIPEDLLNIIRSSDNKKLTLKKDFKINE